MVEVMIAVAIIGSVLAAGFAVTNKNIRASQDTQEQVIAVKLVQQQIELLGSYQFNPATNDCFNTDGTGAQAASGYCGAITSGSSGATYSLKISKDPGNPNPNAYKIEANWTGLNASNKNVTMFYLKAV